MSGERPDTGPGSRYLYAPFKDQDAAFHHYEARLALQERTAIRAETERAVNEEKQKLVERRFNQIDGRLDRIDALISRLAWLIMAAILGGFMSFMLKGGFLGA